MAQDASIFQMTGVYMSNIHARSCTTGTVLVRRQDTAKVIGIGEFPPEARTHDWFALMVGDVTADPWP